MKFVIIDSCKKGLLFLVTTDMIETVTKLTLGKTLHQKVEYLNNQTTTMIMKLGFAMAAMAFSALTRAVRGLHTYGRYSIYAHS